MLIIVIYQVLDSVMIDYRTTVTADGPHLAPVNARLVHRRECRLDNVSNATELQYQVGEGLRELDGYAGDLTDHFTASE